MSLESSIEYGKPLSELSTFGVGGRARLFIEIKTVKEMQELRRYIQKHHLPFWIVGKGSNVLFDDLGFDGLVILNGIDSIERCDNRFTVGAGYSFSLLGNQTARQGFSGLEFASGIPGSVGGAVYMNAGANGGETCDYLRDVTYIDKEGNLTKVPIEKKDFSYRSSPFQDRDVILVLATFELTKALSARKKQLEILRYRLTTQPYREKSAGCVFRNPREVSAGELIDRAGLKGAFIGGAEVSKQHANFIINKGGATALDIIKLVDYIHTEVYRKTGYKLERELCYVPYRPSIRT